MNSIIIMGRLVKDPIVRHTSNGTTVTNFTVAVDRPVQKDAPKQADFIDCIAWRKTGEFVGNYFNKGKPILVRGRLQSRDWEDKNGIKRRSWEIVCEECEFAGGEKVDRKAQPAVPDLGPGEFAELGNDGDLPFDMDAGLDDLPL